MRAPCVTLADSSPSLVSVGNVLNAATMTCAQCVTTATSTTPDTASTASPPLAVRGKCVVLYTKLPFVY